MSLPSQTKPTLLLVDDDSIIADSLEFVLSEEYQVNRASDRLSSFELLNNMETVELVLNALKSAGKPLKAGEIAEATNLDRKEVDKAMKMLKTEGRIVSPKYCFWTVS